MMLLDLVFQNVMTFLNKAAYTFKGFLGTLAAGFDKPFGFVDRTKMVFAWVPLERTLFFI